MRTSAKIITALSVTGLAVVAGSAFTGAGLQTDGQAADAQFVGGTVSQAVTGATLTDLNYTMGVDDEGNQTTVQSVALTFAEGANTKAVVLKLDDVDGAYTCSTITNNASNCTPTVPGVYQADVARAFVTVSNPTTSAN